MNVITAILYAIGIGTVTSAIGLVTVNWSVHLEMTSHKGMKGFVARRTTFISFMKLRKHVIKLLAEDHILRSPSFKASLFFEYTLTELAELYAEDPPVNTYAAAHEKFEWHAGIITIESKGYWMSPWGFSRMKRFIAKDVPKDLCYKRSHTLAMSMAATLKV